MYADALQPAEKRICDACRGQRSGGNDRAPMRRQMAAYRAQGRLRILDEVEYARTKHQIEVATQIERFQLRAHRVIEPRPCDSEHLRANVDAGNRGNP